jgi:hypothetical protein
LPAHKGNGVSHSPHKKCPSSGATAHRPGATKMIGAIRVRDVLAHPVLTVRCFGWKTLFRALVSSPGRTFLSLLTDMNCFGSADKEAATVIKRCVDLELRAKKLYLDLAESTREEPSLVDFFSTLAEQEQEHADLLLLCLAASNRVGWRLSDLPIWRERINCLELEMREAEAIAPHITDAQGAMDLVLRIESSEVNDVFLAVISASNSEFVKKLRPFSCALEMHLAFIATRVPELEHATTSCSCHPEPAESHHCGAAEDDILAGACSRSAYEQD